MFTGDDGGGAADDGKSGDRRTNSRAGDSIHSTGTAGNRRNDRDNNTHTGNSRIHKTPEIRTLFRPIPQRQSAVQG